MASFPFKSKLFQLFLVGLFCLSFVHHVDARERAAITSSDIHLMGAQGVNLWNLEKKRSKKQVAEFEGIAVDGQGSQQAFSVPNPNRESTTAVAATKPSKFRPHWFQQPLDHFAEESDNPHVWYQRYWVNTRHYKPRFGAPVIVLDGGETSGEDRLPFLDTGIVDILAKATGGIGIVLEHRYYGESQPVANLTTDSLRWLNNAQSAADSARFMSKLRLADIGEDITAPNTPWIYYGGSYAGARAAHMKVLYPSLVWGAIASSAVTHAELSNWEYMDIIRRYANQTCTDHLVRSIRTVDLILEGSKGQIGRRVVGALKSVFGLEGLEGDEDFVSVLESPLGAWQARNWDPAVGDTQFDEFCDAINQPPIKKPGSQQSRELELLDLPYEHPERMVEVKLYEDGLPTGRLNLDFSVMNYAKYVKEKIVSNCESGDVEQCFGTNDDSKYQDTDLDQDWRLWTFQYCTEWGYFTTAPPHRNQPTIISRLLTLEYLSKICRQAFPIGEHFVVPALPNVTVVNELGDFALAADRLAFIDGEVDPWRPDTPHADGAPQRTDTLLRPFKVIPGGVHHWDENGLANLEEEPLEIRKIHKEVVEFVQSWLDDWVKERKREE